MHTRTTLTFAVSLTLGAAQPAISGPAGGVVVGGQGTISTPNANTTVINQSSNRLQLNWNSFNVGANESVLFQQPSSTAVAFNHILDQSPSQIFGHIQGNGQVVLINPNGFLIGRTAQLNVNSLVVSSLDAIDFDAASGRYRFSSTSNPGAVINEGTITAGHGGSVTLLGGQVSNSGTIIADFGTVNLAAGRAATLDLAGDGLLRLEVDQQLLTNSTNAGSAVENTGSIRANGGQVLLTANAVKDVFANLINNTGVIRANRIANEGGSIELLGQGGEVTSSGTLDASAGDDKSTGGKVEVLGEHVGLFDNALVDVSGATGGGTALIGGDYHGENPDVLNAERTYVSTGSTINADAGATGDGGHVVVWADEFTRFGGNISSRGGTLSGNGGFVEVSGKQSLDFGGTTNLTADQGVWGTLLLDPDQITITASSTDNSWAAGTHTVAFGDLPTQAVIGGAVIAQLLTTGSVSLNANLQISQDPGANIDAVALSAPASSSLTLNSHGTMALNGNIYINGGDLTLTSAGDLALNGTYKTHGGKIDIESSAFSVLANAATLDAGSGNVHLQADGNVFVNAINGNAVDLWATQGVVSGTSGTIQASSLNLKAGNGIGLPGASGALITDAPVIQATSTNGGIYIDSQGAVYLAQVQAQGNGGEALITADAGDIQVGTVAATNLVQLTSSGGGISNFSSSSSIAANSLTLSAHDDIGSSTSALGVSISANASSPTSGALNATSGHGNVFVTQSGTVPFISVDSSVANGKKVTIDSGSSTLIVDSITATNGIVSLSGATIGDDGSNVTKIDAGTVNLLSTAGAIGSSVGTGDIDITGGMLLASAQSGGLFVHSTGAVNVASVAAVSGNVGVVADQGDMTIGFVSAPGSVSLTASGNAGLGGAMLDGGSHITTGSLSLTAAKSIGTSTQSINTTGGAGALSLQAAATQTGGIYISNTGDLVVQAVSATVGANTIRLNATGSIVGDHNDSTVIAGDDIILNAGGAIGAAGAHNQIDTSANILTATATGGDIYIGDVNPIGVQLKNISATQSGSDVSVKTLGDVTVVAVSAPHNVTLTSTGGSIKDDGSASTFISGSGLTLSAANAIGATGAGNEVDTEVNSLTASAGGGIWVSNLVGDLAVGAVSAPGAVSLTAKTGSLLDDGDDTTWVNGGTGVTLKAATGIGTVANFANLGGSSFDVQTNGALAATVTSNTGQINLNISGAPAIGSGAITLGSGTGRAGSVILQSPNDLNVAGLGAGAINIGTGNTTNVGLSSGGVLIVPANGDFTDAPAHNLLVHGGADVVDNDATPHELSFTASSLNFQSGAAGGNVILDTTVSQLDATIGNNRDLIVNQTGALTLGSISALGGNISITSPNGALSDDGDDTTLLTANSVNLSGRSLGAANNEIDTNAASLNVASSAGGIYIREAGATNLVAAATGGVLDVQTANGPLTVTLASGTGVTLATQNAGNALIVNGAINGGGGPVNLTTFGNGSDIDVNAVVTTAGGAVTLTAGSAAQRGAIVAGSAVGNGNDSGIVASTLTATGSAIGTSAARLNTTVSSLSATTATGASGGIYINESDALTLTASATNGPVDVQTSNGTLTVASAQGNGINLLAGGDNNALTLNGIVNGGAGNIGLAAGGAGGQVNINNQLTTTGDVAISAGTGLVPGAIKTNGGNIKGHTLNVMGGSIGSAATPLSTSVDSLNVTSINSDIYVQDTDALTVTAANALTGAVQISTANGALTVDSVTSSSSGGVNLKASGAAADLIVNGMVSAGVGQMKLTAAGNIVGNTGNLISGSSAILRASAIGADGARLNTSLDSVDAATSNGSMYLNETDALTVTSVVATGNVDIIAGGAISGASGSSIVSGNAVTLTGTTIGTSTARLNTAATSLNATSSNGGIYVNETDGLTLTASATGGALDVTAGGPLAVNSASAEGVTLAATAAASGISINGPVNAGNGPLTLAATGNGGTISVNGAATTLGDATLVAGSSAARGAITGTAGGQIGAGSLSLVGSSIGTSANSINTAVTSLTTTSTNGGTFINEADAITLTSNATGGAVDVQTANGAMVVNGATGTGVSLSAGGASSAITLNGLVAGGTGGVTLTAGSTGSRGAIVAGAGSSVTGSTLTATGSAIGSGSAPLSTAIDTLNADAGAGGVHVSEQDGLTLASVHSTGDVNVVTSSGNINIVSVATSGNATLTSAAGAITDDGDNSTTLAAQSVTLLARSIGAASTLTGGTLDSKSRVDITAQTLDAKSTAGGIYIDALNGLSSVSVRADGGAAGNIELLAPNGDLNLLSVSASNTLLLSAGRNILGLPGLGQITAKSAELRAGASDASAGHIGTLMQPLSLQLDAGNTLRIFVPQTVDSNDPNRAPATLPSSGVLTTLSLFGAPNALAVDAGFGQFQGLSDSLYTSQAESLVHSIQNQTAVVQTVLGLDWGSFDPNVSLFGTLDPSVCLPSDQRDEEAGGAGC